MYKKIKARVRRETMEGTYFTVLAPYESLTDEAKKLSEDGILDGELRINDGRHISSDQRKKSYATLADIALYLGYPPEELKEIMKYNFIAATGEAYFSLGDCSVTTARHFINHLLDFALEWHIPLRDTLLNRTDDINSMIYATIKHRRCIVCGAEGEAHHWDAIGMGRDRTSIDDGDLRKLCLCREHHTEAHTIGHEAFEEKYHVYGIIYRE